MAATKATYWQRGETIDFKNAGDTIIPANTIVKIGARIGVAGTDINPGEVGTLHVAGVFKMEKVTGEITVGAEVYLDADGKITTAASGESEEQNTKAGFAVEAATSSDTYAIVKINA